MCFPLAKDKKYIILIIIGRYSINIRTVNRLIRLINKKYKQDYWLILKNGIKYSHDIKRQTKRNFGTQNQESKGSYDCPIAEC